MTQTIIEGRGKYQELAVILEKYQPGNIFWVKDEQAFTLSGAERLFGELLTHYPHTSFIDFEINPKINDIEKGVARFIQNHCDLVIGFGGGSALDNAKAIALLAGQELGSKGEIEKYITGKKTPLPGRVPTIMIPTTAGTGSESTHFCVVYIKKEKFSFAHPSLLPDYAILDPLLTDSLPPYLTSCTGMDALCQGIESFWSVNATAESENYSRQAIQLAIANIVGAVRDQDKSCRDKMLLASNLAGRAINITKTTAPHALSYAFTSYFNIPHGHAVALTIPLFILYNAGVTENDVQHKQGVNFVKQQMQQLFQLLGAASAQEAHEKILLLMETINLESNPAKLSIKKNDLELITGKINLQRVKNNPRRVEKPQITAWLKSFYP